MRIGYDISPLHFSSGGTAVVTREVLAALHRGSHEHTLKEISCPIRNPDQPHGKADVLRWQFNWTRSGIQKAVRKHQLDLVHVPSTIAPSHIDVPLVVTIYDIFPIRLPETAKVWHRKSIAHFLPKVLERADHVITISHYTKGEILEAFPRTNAEKLVPVHLGVHPQFGRVEDNAQAAAREKYGLHKPVILSVCSLEPRKNLARLIEAFARLKNQCEHQLVLVGEFKYKVAQLTALIEHHGLTNRIITTGYVPFEDLPALYSLADAFVYPSIYEGFGLPVLEAMRCGCPVLASNVTSIPEIAGGHAVLVDPLQVDEITSGLQQLISTPSGLEAAREHAETFTWERTVEKTLSVYEKAI